MALVGLRFGGTRLAVDARLRLGRLPVHAVRLELEHERRDLPPLFLIWGFWLVTSPRGPRRAAVALAGWTKFAPLLVAPLWAVVSRAARRADARCFVAGFLAATLAAFSILLLEPSPLHAARVFWDRTLGWQIGRDSPFSIWDWRQYHAGPPRPAPAPARARGRCSSRGAVASCFVPRRKSPLQLAALTAALLLGFELVLTHWFYLYLPWFFPFAAFAVLAPVAEPSGPACDSPLNVLAKSWSASNDAAAARLRRRRRLPRLPDRPPLGLLPAQPDPRHRRVPPLRRRDR